MATQKQTFNAFKNALANGNYTLPGLIQCMQNYLGALENATGGGGGGSEVSYTQTLESGSECGTITIDGVGTKIYAPTPAEPTSVSVTQVQTTGTKIATVTVDSVATDIYAPSAGSAGSVSVTADGVKTLAQLFNELHALIDGSKVNGNTVLVKDLGNGNSRAYQLHGFGTTDYTFVTSEIYSQKLNIGYYTVKSSGSKSEYIDGSTYTDSSSTVEPSGHVFTIYY